MKEVIKDGTPCAVKVACRELSEKKAAITSKNYLSLSNRAEKIAKNLAAERGVDDNLYRDDSLEWILASEKIQEEVQSTLQREIQQ